MYEYYYVGVFLSTSIFMYEYLGDVVWYDFIVPTMEFASMSLINAA